MSPSTNGHEGGLSLTPATSTGSDTPLGERDLLEGFSIVLTHGMSGEPDTLAERLRQFGAAVLSCPCIEIIPPEDVSPLKEAISHLAEYDWILFTSKNAVEAVVPLLRVETRGGHCRIAAVGPATQRRLEESGLPVALVSVDGTGKGLAQALIERGEVPGHRFLFPAAEIAREELPSLLERSGGRVDRVTAYRTVTYRGTWSCLEWLLHNTPTGVCFASPSAAKGLREKLGEAEFRRITHGTVSFSIGKTTTATLQELGIERIIQAESPSMESLFKAIHSSFREIG